MLQPTFRFKKTDIFSFYIHSECMRFFNNGFIWVELVNIVWIRL